MSYKELKVHGTEEFPIELYHIDKNHTRFEMASHWHSHIEIIKVLSGELNTKLYNNEYIAKKGDIVFVNSEVVHGAMPSEDCIYECIVLNIEMLSSQDSACGFFIDGIMNHEYYVDEFHPFAETTFHLTVNSLFHSMNNIVSTEDKLASAADKFSVFGALYTLFSIIIKNGLYKTYSVSSLPKDKNLEKLKSVLSFIRGNYDKQITLGEMAGSIGMSSKYFCRFFKSMTRKTPFEYLVAYRVEKAARKLLSTDMNVTEVAYSSGFNDLSYFVKIFKAQKGVTPAAFRSD